MPLELEGGCLVTGLREGEPVRNGDLLIWNHFRGDAVSMRVLQLGGRATLRNDEGDEVLYILERDTGIHLPAGAEVELEGALTVVGVSSVAPLTRPSATLSPLTRGEGLHADPSPRLRGEGGAKRRMRGPDPLKPAATRLADAPLQRTGDRWYRELIQSEITQFVGSIPPGRAPDHFHLYEEVLCILQGSGFMWAGKSKTPITAGSCIYLPKKQVHCVENTTSGELRLLGVFYPAGSPAVRYSEP